MGNDTSAEVCQAIMATNDTAPNSTISSGVRINALVTNVLFNNYSGLCRFLDNNSTNDYFIPQGIQSEFTSVLQSPPPQLAQANCTMPVPPASSTFSATPTISYPSFEIFQEGGPLTPTSPAGSTSITNIAVPTQQSILRVGTVVSVNVVNSTTNNPIEFYYSRQDCRINGSGATVCNTWNIKEVQKLTYTAAPSVPAGNDGHWVLTKVDATFYMQDKVTMLWNQITGPESSYTPPASQSCTVAGVTHADGTTWVTNTTSTQTPTAAECPYGAGTRLDTMQTATTYVCNDGTSSVQSTGTPTETGYTGACAAAPTPEYVWVADQSNNRIQVFDTNGVYQFQFGSAGTGNGKFNNPWDIHTDGHGNFFVTDSANSRVQKFDSNGNFLQSIGSYGTGNGQFNTPDNIGISTSTGDIWVTDEYYGSGSKGSGGGGNGAVDVFSSAGTFKWRKTSGYSLPTGLGFDQSGNVWMTNSGTSQLYKLDTTNGNILKTVGSAGTGNGQFGFIWAVGFDTMGRMWIPDYGNNRVQVFDSNGNFLFKFGSAGTGNGQFNGPIAVAIDTSNTVYVTDQQNHRVEVFDQNGNFLRKWGSQGSASGQFSWPTGIVTTSPAVHP